MKTVDFKVFRGAADLKDGRVVCLRVPGGAKISRKEIDDYTTFVAIYGAKGLAWIKVNDLTLDMKGLEFHRPFSSLTDLDKLQMLAGIQSPIVKFLPECIFEFYDL